MNQLKPSFFLPVTLLVTALSFSSCEGIFENIYDKPIESNTAITKERFNQVNTTSYTSWVYIQFDAPQATLVEIEENKTPDNWDIAIHRYDIKTNDGAVLKTDYTSIEELTKSGNLPQGTFYTDEWTTDKIAIDMSGMMDGHIVYTDSYYNPVLSTWLNVDTSTMPPVYTMSGNVYLIRLKDCTYAAIRFSNYTNAKGVKGYIDFDYKYPVEFNDNKINEQR